MRLIPRGSSRERILVAVGGFVLAWILRVIGVTSRPRYIGAEGLLACFGNGQQVILAFWHGRMLMMPFGYQGRRACIMNSRHRDGALISRAIERFGVEVVHGSSSRGWVGGLKGLLAAAQRGCDLVVVPDGPRGPRCRAKAGVIQLARSTGLPIYPVSYAARPHAVLRRSWDWLCVPWPGARVVYAVGEPLWVEREASPEALEFARLELESRLNGVTELADASLGVASGFTAEYTGGGTLARKGREEPA